MTEQIRAIPLMTRLSHIALWPACYTLGVYLLIVYTLELPLPDWATVLFLLLVAHSCYLLDRVKLSDKRQDPADAIALPDRALLFAERSIQIRIMLFVELLIAMLSGFFISPLLVLIPLGALIGVQFYAGRGASPSKPRMKDLPALKSFFISSAHIALVVAVLWGQNHALIGHPEPIVLLSLLGLWLIVSGDAILCDLDDHRSDALYGTRSLPVLLGDTRAWLLAEGLIFLGCAMLLIRNQHPIEIVVVSVFVFASTLPTKRMKNRRDLVDSRLLPIVLLALLMR